MSTNHTLERVERLEPPQWRELARRPEDDEMSADGLVVRLLWAEWLPTMPIRLEVVDHQANTCFVVHVRPDQAMHAFEHPMLYEPGGVSD